MSAYDNWLLQSEPGHGLDDVTDEMRDAAWQAGHAMCENCGDTICVSETCECPEPAALADAEDPGLLYCSRQCRREHGGAS